MEKPIRPTKPRLQKIPAPGSKRNDYYVPYADDAQVPPISLFLTLDPESLYDELVDDEDELDEYDFLTVFSLEDITRVAVREGLDPKHLSIMVVEDYLVLRDTAPISNLSQLQEDHRRAVAAEQLRYQEAVVSYPAALERYQRQLTEYKIWKAETRLETLRKQKRSVND